MRPGELLGGRFEIQREAGAGGMGTVYQALDRQSGTAVAVKVLSSFSDVDMVRFDQEAVVLAELRDANVVRYVAHGSTADGERYLAMEWLEGEDLANRLQRGPLSPADSVEVVRQAAAGLVSAHSRGIVHRDIKPSNLFLKGGALDAIRVLDFGIARRRGGPMNSLTRTGAIVGTPGYMAPEQARGTRALDSRADVFALGCVLYECLIGQPAFAGDNLLAVLAKVLLDDPPGLQSLRPDLPQALGELIARMLAKDPDERPRDAAAILPLLDALGPLQDTASVDSVLLGRSQESAITGHEQRVVCVVLANAPSITDTEFAATISTDDLSLRIDAVRQAIHPLGARFEMLADGSMIALLADGRQPTDLASRAARCALALRSELRDARIVVATGRAVLTNRLPVGDVIDRAVRALAGATAGGPARIDAATDALVASRFSVGHDENGAFLAGGDDIAEATRTVAGRPTSCVGRDPELATLDAVIDECLEERTARAVVVTGSAGAGKTRLATEFLARTQRRGREFEVLHGRADPVGAGGALGIVRSALRRAARLTEDATAEARRERLVSFVDARVPATVAPRIAALLGEIAGESFPEGTCEALDAARRDPTLMGDALRDAWEDFLASIGSTRAVIIVLEDLHWGDLPTVQLIERTLRNLRDRPVFVLALARPEVQTLFPALWSEHEPRWMPLSPLPRRACERLVRQVLGEDAPLATVERLATRCEGNAFFLEELLRAVDASADRDHLPDTVFGAVQARLDVLDEGSRRILRAASVFGETFWPGGVSALLGRETSHATLSMRLADLSSREVLTSTSPGVLAGETVAYRFRHALVRDAAYQALTPGDRTLGHRLAGAWLVGAGETDALTLAEHFDRGEGVGQAIVWYHRAAEHALERGDNAAAIKRCERAALLGAEGLTLGLLWRVRAEAHDNLGEGADAARCAREAVAILREGSVDYFRAAMVAISNAFTGGDAATAEAWAIRVVTVPVDPGAESSLVLLLMAAGMTTPLHSRMDLSVRIADRIATFMANPGRLDLRATAHAAVNRAVMQFYFNADARGLDIDGMMEAIEALDRSGDARNALPLRSQIAMLVRRLGRPALAVDLCRRSLVAAERLAVPAALADALNQLSDALLDLGEAGAARPLAERALAIYRSQQSPFLQAAALTSLARVARLEGDHAIALSLSHEAVTLAGRSIIVAHQASVEVSAALLGLGRAFEALVVARDNQAAVSSFMRDMVDFSPEVRVQVALAYEASGDRAAAMKALGEAVEGTRRAVERTDAPWNHTLLERVEQRQVVDLARAWGVPLGNLDASG